MKILLYEHISGGGFAGEPLPSSLLSEGYAMIRGLTADFKAAGHNVTVLLDSRLTPLVSQLNADHTVQVSSNTIQMLTETAQTVKATFVVAPELNGVLQSIVTQMEQLGVQSLNCPSEIIGQAANKAALIDHVKQLGLNVPKTCSFQTAYVNKDQTLREMDFPVAVKPVNSAGCGGLSVANSQEQVEAAINKIKTFSPTAQVLVQELINGIPASVSLISTGATATPISLNGQDITLTTPSSESNYNGGMVPLDSSLKDTAFYTAKQVVESFKRLQGYVGVDLVLTEEKVYVIEVNPRLTTSYVGLRKVANFNLAQAIINAITKQKLPFNPQCHGYAYFSKVPLTCPAPTVCKESKVPTVFLPPASFDGDKITYAFVEAYANTAENAFTKLAEIKKGLQHIGIGGK